MNALPPEVGYLTLPASGVVVEYVEFGGRVLHAREPLQRCLVLIPGNPGLVRFYERFLGRLQAACPTIGVLGVGFTGHSSRDVNGARRFTLDDQLQHRLELLDHVRALHPGVRISLAGHSIGAFLCLEVLRLAGDRDAFEKAFLLFPTLRDLEAQAGPYRIAVAPGLRQLVIAASSVLTRAPDGLKRSLVARFGPAATDCPGVIESLLQPATIANVLHLAATEFRQVRALDAVTIERHLDKLVFHYGAADGWVPADHHADLKARFPAHPHVYMDTHGCDHAFCLTHSDVVADFVSQHLPR